MLDLDTEIGIEWYVLSLGGFIRSIYAVFSIYRGTFKCIISTDNDNAVRNDDQGAQIIYPFQSTCHTLCTEQLLQIGSKSKKQEQNFNRKCEGFKSWKGNFIYLSKIERGGVEGERVWLFFYRLASWRRTVTVSPGALTRVKPHLILWSAWTSSSPSKRWSIRTRT